MLQKRRKSTERPIRFCCVWQKSQNKPQIVRLQNACIEYHNFSWFLDALELSKEMEADLPKSKFIDKLTDAMCADQDTNPEKKTEYLKNMNDIRKQSELVKKCLDLRRVEFKQEIDRRKNELEAKMDKNTKDFEAFIAKVMENLKEIANGDD